MRILVTGREGQVVRALIERHARRHEIVAIGRPALDLAGPGNSIGQAIEAARPDIVVSAAAYTAVDKAEAERDLAFAINASGAEAVAHAARRMDLPLIHLSTDYVFDGDKQAAYLEEDATRPVTAYGASKLAGERAVAAVHGDSVILRTAWVYSPFGGNFVKTMLRLAGTNDSIRVVADQVGNPTSALALADGIVAVAERLASDPDPSLRGVFHMTGTGEASWADFARAIFDVSKELGGPFAEVEPIGTADYPTPARRPANSRLDGGKLAAAYRVRLPDWRESLRPVVERLVA